MSLFHRDADAPSVRLRCKVILLGDFSTGKTTFCNVANYGPTGFKKDYVPTSSVNLYQSVVRVDNEDAEVEFYLLDSPGLESWASHGDSQIPSCNYFIFFGDTTQSDIPQQIQTWYKRVADVRVDDVIPGAVVLNKVDLFDESTADSIAAPVRKFAELKKLKFFETSAVRNDRAPMSAVLKELAIDYFNKYQHVINEAKKYSSD